MARSPSAKPYLIRFLMLVLLAVVAIQIMGWVRAHPQHFRSAPFSLAHDVGWATRAKLADLSTADAACFAVMDTADVGYERRATIGEGVCRASQRMIFTSDAHFPAMEPARAAPSCAVSAAMILWQRERVAPQAEALFGQKVVRIENMGSYNCRNVRGGSSPSQHSSANAIDISAFVLADGTRISVLEDWDDVEEKGAFLRAVRDGACDIFTTSLSPDYNAAHANHFHFDLANRTGGWSVCV